MCQFTRKKKKKPVNVEVCIYPCVCGSYSLNSLNSKNVQDVTPYSTYLKYLIAGQLHG